VGRLAVALGLSAAETTAFASAAKRPMSGFGRPSLGEDPDAFPAGGALGCEHRQAGSDQRHNLPVQFTTFVGRERDATDISRLLLDHRLVSLTGVGGVGKTRLALRVASDLMANQHQGVLISRP